MLKKKGAEARSAILLMPETFKERTKKLFWNLDYAFTHFLNDANLCRLGFLWMCILLNCFSCNIPFESQRKPTNYAQTMLKSISAIFYQYKSVHKKEAANNVAIKQKTQKGL